MSTPKFIPLLSQLHSSQVVAQGALHEPPEPLAPAPEASASPVRDESESPKEEDFAGVFIRCIEPISRWLTIVKMMKHQRNFSRPTPRINKGFLMKILFGDS